VRTRAGRAELAALAPRPGTTIVQGHVQHVVREDDALVLRRLPLASLRPGDGPLAAPLPEPFEAVVLRGDVDRGALAARLASERTRVLGMYGLAAVILVVGTAYAFVAIGRAHRLARAKSDFVANVTHELKTPLANIRLFAESLADGRVRDGDRREFLATILDETGRLDALVEGLLHAARGPRIARAPVDLRALLLDTAERWRPRLERAGFALRVEAPALPAIEGDGEALRRALGNLLDNARKYGDAARGVELSGEARNGHVRLSVRDYGPGIPVADRRRVVAPFARLESADRKETEGTGLGLSLVVSCVEAHGGSLEIGGDPGDGARVTLVLPAGAP
jgi:signal transduction histidine kinase